MGRLRPDSARPVNSTIEGHAANLRELHHFDIDLRRSLAPRVVLPRQKTAKPATSREDGFTFARRFSGSDEPPVWESLKDDLVQHIGELAQ